MGRMPSRHTRSERRALWSFGVYAVVLWIVTIVLYVNLAPHGVGQFLCFVLVSLATLPYVIFREFLKRRAIETSGDR
jgi:hypothetical protein